MRSNSNSEFKQHIHKTSTAKLAFQKLSKKYQKIFHCVLDCNYRFAVTGGRGVRGGSSSRVSISFVSSIALQSSDGAAISYKLKIRITVLQLSTKNQKLVPRNYIYYFNDKYYYRANPSLNTQSCIKRLLLFGPVWTARPQGNNENIWNFAEFMKSRTLYKVSYFSCFFFISIFLEKRNMKVKKC